MANGHPGRPRPRFRPGVESLEGRITPVVGALNQPAALDPSQFPGIVSVVGDPFAGTGTLLYTGRQILTAAHLFDQTPTGGIPTITFHLPLGQTVVVPVARSAVRFAPGWATAPDVNAGGDLAVLTLTDPEGTGGQLVAPIAAGRYDIYRGAGEIGQPFTFYGYGGTGTGATGATAADGQLRQGSNQFDADWSKFAALPGWTLPVPTSGTVLGFDFDDGTAQHDAYGQVLGLPGTGLGKAEAMTAAGDSGGPAFLGGGQQIVGVASLGMSYASPPDVDGQLDSSFGEFGGFTRVSAYQGFIDSAVSGRYALVFDMNYQLREAANSLRVVRSGDQLQFILNGHADPTVYRVSDIDRLTIRGTDGDDTISLEGLAGAFPGGVAVDGRGGRDILSVSDSSPATFRPTAATAGTVDGGYSYQNVEQLVGADGRDTLDLGKLAGGVTVAADPADGPGFRLTVALPGGPLVASGMAAVVGTPQADRLFGDTGVWEVTGPNAGRGCLSAGGVTVPMLTFGGFETLAAVGGATVRTGGSLAGDLLGLGTGLSTFRVEAGGAVAGVVDGGAGGTALDLTQFGPLAVQVAAPGTSVGFAGSVGGSSGSLRFDDLLTLDADPAAGASSSLTSGLTGAAQWSYTGGAATLTSAGRTLSFTALATWVGGPGADDFTVRPSGFLPFNIAGNAPDAAPGDRLTLLFPPEATGRRLVKTSPGSGQWTFATLQPVTFSGIEALVPDAQPVVYRLDGLPNQIMVGRPITVSVTALDQYGQPVTAYTGSVTVAVTDPSGIYPTSVPIVAGSGVFTVALRTAGVQTLFVRDAQQPLVTGQASVAVVMPPVVTDDPSGLIGLGIPYRFVFTLGQGVEAAYALTAGVLPPGLTLTPDGTLSGTPTQAGTFRGTVTATNAAGSQDVSFTLSVAVPSRPLPPGVVDPPPPPPVQVPPPPTPPVGVPATPAPSAAGEFAVAGGGTVRFFNPDGSQRFAVAPFPGWFGELRTATADFNGDGVADVVVGTGPGGPSHVLVLDGVTQQVLFAVDPFEAAFTGGVFVAAGDLNGDGVADLVITPDQGGGPRVRVFSGQGFGQMLDFLGINDPNFRGGARAAVGDLNDDGVGDLIVAAGAGGGPRVAGFDGRSIAAGSPANLFPDFFAFETALRNGVYVAAGDLDGDGFADVVTGGGPGGAPRVSAFDGRTLVRQGAADRRIDFFAGDTTDRGGARVAAKDLDGDGRADLVVGSGSGAGSRVSTYRGAYLTAGVDLPASTFDAFPGFAGGVFVG